MVYRPWETSKIAPWTEETHKKQMFTELVKLMEASVSHARTHAIQDKIMKFCDSSTLFYINSTLTSPSLIL